MPCLVQVLLLRSFLNIKEKHLVTRVSFYEKLRPKRFTEQTYLCC